MPPTYWTMFVALHALQGKSIRMSATCDKSGIGADIGILSVEQSVDEATNFWPGIVVARDGFVPVGSCLTGSGDYYYLNTHDGPGEPLYRISHDAVTRDGYEAGEAIAVVLSNYEELSRHVRT